MERKKEFILLLLNSQNSHTINPEITTYLEHYFAQFRKHHLNSKEQMNHSKKTLSIGLTIQLTKIAQKKIIDNINDQYFKKTDLEASQKPYKDNNAILYSIAIFMQLIGLILVLSRDLARR